MAAKSDDKFKIFHKSEKDGNHTLIIHPMVANEGYSPREISITEEQWNALRYHFVIGYSNFGDDKLFYVH
jgi:hypothetical protein